MLAKGIYGGVVWGVGGNCEFPATGSTKNITSEGHHIDSEADCLDSNCKFPWHKMQIKWPQVMLSQWRWGLSGFNCVVIPKRREERTQVEHLKHTLKDLSGQRCCFLKNRFFKQ